MGLSTVYFLESPNGCYKCGFRLLTRHGHQYHLIHEFAIASLQLGPLRKPVSFVFHLLYLMDAMQHMTRTLYHSSAIIPTQEAPSALISTPTNQSQFLHLIQKSHKRFFDNLFATLKYWSPFFAKVPKRIQTKLQLLSNPQLPKTLLCELCSLIFLTNALLTGHLQSFIMMSSSPTLTKACLSFCNVLPVKLD